MKIAAPDRADRRYAKPPAPPRAPDAATSRLATIRSEIDAVYERHNPAKLEAVDGLLARCAGSEEALLEAIKRKYESDDDGDDNDDAGPRDRAKVVLDVVSSERRFEATLELMEACYATPLRRHFEEVGAAPTGAAKALLGLFAAADAIRGFARMLRGDLEAAVSVQETPRKPGVFRLWRPVSRSIWVRFGYFLDR